MTGWWNLDYRMFLETIKIITYVNKKYLPYHWRKNKQNKILSIGMKRIKTKRKQKTPENPKITNIRSHLSAISINVF